MIKYDLTDLETVQYLVKLAPTQPAIVAFLNAGVLS